MRGTAGWCRSVADGRWDLSETRANLDRIHEFVEAEERDPEDLDVLGRLHLESDDPDTWLDGVRSWQDLGATHLAVDTMDSGLEPSEHSTRILRFMHTVEDANVKIAD